MVSRYRSFKQRVAFRNVEFCDIVKALKNNTMEEDFPMKTQAVVKFPFYDQDYTFKLSDTHEHQSLCEGDAVVVDTSHGYAVAEVVRLVEQGKEAQKPQKRVVCKVTSLQERLDWFLNNCDVADKRTEKKRRESNRKERDKAMKQVEKAQQALDEAQKALKALG